MTQRNGHTPRLRLAQELFLLGLHPSQGRLKSPHLRIGVAGVALMELCMLGHLALQGKKLIVVGSIHTGDPVLDEVMRRVSAVRHSRSLRRWVRRLGHTRPSLVHSVGESLGEQGIVEVRRKRILKIIRYTVYPLPDPQPRQRIADRIRLQLLDEEAEIDARTATLASVGQTLGLLREHFTGSERRQVRRRVKQLRKDDAFSRAVGETIAEMHAAVSAAVAASAAASAAGSSGS